MRNIWKWFGKVAIGMALIAAAAGNARANGIIDPVMRVLDDEFSNAILQGTTFFPNGNGGGVFGFFNTGNQNITELSFQAFIAPNLSAPTITAGFSCNQGNLNPFFEFCGVSYVASTGALTISFWGTNPVTNPGGLQQGVPTLPPGCLSTPDAAGCGTSGHFAVSLAGQSLLSAPDINAPDQSGGWSYDSNPSLFTPGGPIFTATEVKTVYGALPNYLATPEPAPIALFVLGFAGLIWLRARRPRGADPDPESRS